MPDQKRMVVHSAFEKYDVLIDRTTKYGNRYWEFGASKDDPVQNKIAAFGKQVISDLETGKLSLWDIYNLKGKVLGCHCATPQNPDAPCHGRILLSMIPDVENVLRKNGILTDDGRRRVGQFNGDFRFLSNFYEFLLPIYFKGQSFTSTEVAYQYSKYYIWQHMHRGGKCEVPPPVDFESVINMTPKESKAYSASHRLPDKVMDVFDLLKFDMMKDLVYQKFSINPSLGEALVGTKDWELVEGNWWSDTYWGYCMKTNTGQNNLGIILMEVRSMIAPDHAEF